MNFFESSKFSKNKLQNLVNSSHININILSGVLYGTIALIK